MGVPFLPPASSFTRSVSHTVQCRRARETPLARCRVPSAWVLALSHRAARLHRGSGPSGPQYGCPQRPRLGNSAACSPPRFASALSLPRLPQVGMQVPRRAVGGSLRLVWLAPMTLPAQRRCGTRRCGAARPKCGDTSRHFSLPTPLARAHRPSPSMQLDCKEEAGHALAPAEAAAADDRTASQGVEWE